MEHQLKACEVCGQTIEKEYFRNWNRYAKKRISYGHLRSAPISQGERPCESCGKTCYTVARSLCVAVSTARKSSRRAREYTCEVCGKVFTQAPSARSCAHVYCGKECQGIAKRKNKPETQGRRSPADLAWKAAVLAHDGYRCQNCGSDLLSHLEAHHIRPIYGLLRTQARSRRTDALPQVPLLRRP